MTRLLLTLALNDPADLTRLSTFAKADLTHLLPKKIMQKDGRMVTHYVRRYTGPGATRAAAQGAASHSERLAILRSWQKHAVADALHPQDAASARFITQLEGEADASFDHDDWTDPVGEAPRTLSRITDPATLAAIQARLYSSSTHKDQAVRLVEAYDLDFEHPAFDAHAAQVGDVRSLYHGVGPARAAAVIASGLKPPKGHASTTGQMFGPGIYFADSSTKSVQYITGKFSRRNGTGIMLECDVALGHSHEASEGMEGLENGRPVYLEDEDEYGGPTQQQGATDWNDFTSVYYHFVNSGKVTDGEHFARHILGVNPEAYLSGAIWQAFQNYPIPDEYAQRVKDVWTELGAHPDRVDVDFTLYDDATVDHPRFRALRKALEDTHREMPYGHMSLQDALNAKDEVLSMLQDLIGLAVWDAWTNKKAQIQADYEGMDDEGRDEGEPEPDSAERFDSVTGLTKKQGGVLQHPEFIVYDQDHCKLRRVLVVERQKR